MTYSNGFLMLLAVLFIVPIVAVAIANFLYRKRGGIAKGWGGVLFVCLCWIAGLAIILQKVAR